MEAIPQEGGGGKGGDGGDMVVELEATIAHFMTKMATLLVERVLGNEGLNMRNNPTHYQNSRN